jgi:hypothetical protein
MDDKSILTEDEYGNKYWTRKDEYGNKYWYENGLLHRLDGPAVEYANGDKEWWQNARLHRLDGPAREWIDGRKEWWIRNKLYKTKETYFNSLPRKSKEKCLFSKDFLNG